ncbi:hypothetical protein Plhal304r1_c016g0059311 [Plasmopara halstedii]
MRRCCCSKRFHKCSKLSPYIYKTAYPCRLWCFDLCFKLCSAARKKLQADADGHESAIRFEFCRINSAGWNCRINDIKQIWYNLLRSSLNICFQPPGFTEIMHVVHSDVVTHPLQRMA